MLTIPQSAQRNAGGRKCSPGETLSRRDRQAYCLYIRRLPLAAADIQTLVGVNPEPPYFSAGRKDKGDYIGKPKSKTKMVAMRFCDRDYDEIKRKAEYPGMNFTQLVTAASIGTRIAVIDRLDDVSKE